MRVVYIDNKQDEENPEMYLPSFALVVEMTQEEYRLCCYYLEKDKRAKKK